MFLDSTDRMSYVKNVYDFFIFSSGLTSGKNSWSSSSSLKSCATFTYKPTSKYLLQTSGKDLQGDSYMVEQGQSPIFSTEFGKIVYILADFGKQEYCRTGKFYILKDGIWQSSNFTDTVTA